ncbi:MAG: peroxidase-related enzyme [Cognatishimia sp.]
MTERPISRYSVPDVNALPEDPKSMILGIQKKGGGYSECVSGLCAPTRGLRAFMAYHDALIEKESGLSQADREMIVVATSNDNSRLYCVIAHGAILRIRVRNPMIADQVATNCRKANVTPRQVAMLDFALKVFDNAVAIDEFDFETLHGHGFNDEDIWDIEASRRSSGCPTGWRMSPRCARMTNST